MVKSAGCWLPCIPLRSDGGDVRLTPSHLCEHDDIRLFPRAQECEWRHIRTIEMFVSVMISGLIVRCCAVPTSDDVQLRLEGGKGRRTQQTGGKRTGNPDLYRLIHRYTALYISYTSLYFSIFWRYSGYIPRGKVAFTVPDMGEFILRVSSAAGADV